MSKWHLKQEVRYSAHQCGRCWADWYWSADLGKVPHEPNRNKNNQINLFLK